MKRSFQRCIVRTEILSTFHARVEYISVKTAISRKMDLQQHAVQRWRFGDHRPVHSFRLSAHRRTYTQKWNSISASFTPFTWWI